MENKTYEEKREELLNSLSKEVRAEAESIINGARGLMPITSNKIEIVWVHPCGYGRKAILSVNQKGRKEFGKVMKFCGEQYKLIEADRNKK